MANITQNGINFTVETGGKTHQGWTKKYTNADNIFDGIYDPDPNDIQKSINAVEIDWNGATLGSTVINTTGDLLKYIKDKSNLTLGALNTSKTISLKATTTYKWHIGTTSPDKTSWSESDFNKTSQSPITSFTAVTSNPFTIWIVPNSWGTVSSMKTGGELRNQWITPVPWNPTLPAGYTAYYTTFSADTPITDITWSN